MLLKLHFGAKVHIFCGTTYQIRMNYAFLSRYLANFAPKLG